MESCSGKANIKRKEESGTVIISCTGYAYNYSIASNNAQYNTFYQLMFKGLPGTEFSKPLIENEREARYTYPEYFKKFFNQSYYVSYIMWSSISSVRKIAKGKFATTIEMKVNYYTLKKDLERNFIIPRTDD